jgi:hypothetical protein
MVLQRGQRGVWYTKFYFWDEDGNKRQKMASLPAAKTRGEALEAEQATIEGFTQGNPRFTLDQMRRQQQLTSLVYFIQPFGGGPIKIGQTRDIIKRLKGIQACSPIPLNVLKIIRGDTEVEAKIHTDFARHNTFGEWFEATPELLEFIERLPSEVVVASGDYQVAPKTQRGCLRYRKK